MNYSRKPLEDGSLDTFDNLDCLLFGHSAEYAVKVHFSAHIRFYPSCDVQGVGVNDAELDIFDGSPGTVSAFPYIFALFGNVIEFFFPKNLFSDCVGGGGIAAVNDISGSGHVDSPY